MIDKSDLSPDFFVDPDALDSVFLETVKKKVPCGILLDAGLLSADEANRYLDSVRKNEHEPLSGDEAVYWRGFLAGMLEAACV